ncbi:hypothetical protein RRG08_035493 [Elysia crispata]|uniref:Uncharacterized protein n=1 Tax=Elysia crispata TaxID=231223 RepID=A0AAE1AQ65_9GAST|nr:hypothetical protein RRG08_035493 [Elysia crispata]
MSHVTPSTMISHVKRQSLTRSMHDMPQTLPRFMALTDVTSWLLEEIQDGGRAQTVFAVCWVSVEVSG